MKRFSERKGYKPVSDVIQTESMSDELRNSIWNVLDEHIWSRVDFVDDRFCTQPGIYRFSRHLWAYFYKEPSDSRRDDPKIILAGIRHRFFKLSEWYEVYDFIEVIIPYFTDLDLAHLLNEVLERELSGYRIIDGIVTDVTDKQEVEMLEAALQDTQYEGVAAHLKTALELLSRRDSPDYRNSIKESFSAVESIARIIVDDDKATLGQALKVLEKDNKLHRALKEGFSKLYGYTSDEGGIRHAMLKEPDLDGADAKYFLLSCTSFVNYLKAKI